MPLGLFRRRPPATPELEPAAPEAVDPSAAPLFPMRPPATAIAEPPPIAAPRPIPIRPLPEFQAPEVATAITPAPAPAPESEPAPAPPVSIGPRLPHGPMLDDLVTDGRALAAIELHKQSILTRPDPFHAEPMVDGVSAFADEFTDPARRVSEPEASRLVALDDVVVLGRDGISIWRDQILFHSMLSVEAWRQESRIAQADDQGSLVLKAPVDNIVPVAGPLLMGFVGAWMNYAHWMTECLPRAFAFLVLRQREPAVRLIVPNLPADGPQMETLRWLGITPEQLYVLHDNQAIRAAKLWCVSGVGGGHPPVLVRAAALHLSAAIPLDLNEAEGLVANRVYIHRGMATRRLVNFEELRPVLDRFGFNVVRMHDFGAQTQVRLMRNARHVIGENSGGLSNVMFCRRGARLLELNNPAFPHPAHWALMGLVGGGYGFCVGRHVGDGVPNMNSDYSIPAEDFSRAVEALVAA